MKTAVVTLAAVSMCLAGEAFQTDWSGGQSAVQVVTDWENFYWQLQDLSATAIPGQLSLSSTPLGEVVEDTVNADVSLAGMDAGDLDYDGLVDLVGASLNDGHVYWFRNTGTGRWNTEELTGSFYGALGCDVVDMDGDGYDDVLGAIVEPDMILLWKNQGGAGPTGSPLVVDSLFPGVHCVVGCHVDDDGSMDLMGAANECDQIAVFYNLGDDSWQKVVVDSTFKGTQSVSPADFDGDGDTDAAAAAGALGQFAWWENPGNRTDPWVKHVLADGMSYPHHVIAVDMNSDGLADVLGSSYGDAKVLWWENDGSGPTGWEEHTVTQTLFGALTGIPADFDGDGDMDVAGAGWSTDDLMWYENTDGSAETWQEHVVSGFFNGVWPLACGDFSANGRLELAAGADVLTGPGTSRGPSIFDLCGFVDQGTLYSTILDTAEDPQWAGFEAELESASGTSTEIYWRSSDDYENMGDWTGPFGESGELSGILQRYVQYKIEMSSEDSLASPILLEISLYWDPSGVGDEQSHDEPLFFADRNPSVSGYVGLTLAGGDGPLETRFELFDLCGRVMGSSTAMYGGEEVVFGPLPSGQYIVRAVSGEESSVCKIVVLQ